MLEYTQAKSSVIDRWIDGILWTYQWQDPLEILPNFTHYFLSISIILLIAWDLKCW